MPPPRLLVAYQPRPLLRQRPLLLLLRRRATTSSSSKDSHRKSITLTSDTGRIPWTALSTGEKAVRSTQQTFNFALVLVGLGLTLGVSYVLYAEVFSPSSKTAVFNRTVTRIRSDKACIAALVGDSTGASRSWNLNVFGGGSDRGKQIAAYGEGSWSRWARNRTVASNNETDRRGVEHFRMHFYVAGPKAEGTVWVHMTRRPGGDWEYYTLAVDVEGQERLWLENAEKTRADSVRGGKMFGVRWW